MIAQVQQTEVEKAIASSQHHGYYDMLVKNEPCINWFALCAKLYRVSHSIGTGMNYCKSACVFREMLAQNYKITLCATITEIKANEKRAYELLDEFVTWCDAVKQYKPRTTRSFYINVTKVLRYTGIELEESKLEDISLPRPTEMADDYPENNAILGILNAASLTIRGYLQLILDTGFEPVDAAQLQIKDIHFDEAMPRINKAREKTGKKLEGFLSDETANTIKALIETKGKGPNDYVFCKSYKSHTVNKLREMYNLALAKAGYGEVVKAKRGFRARIVKIDGHKFGKYHLKVYKKRWFSLVVSNKEVPTYVAQAMLGRSAYLVEYYRQPLEKRQEFAKKILKIVSVYASKIDKQEVMQKASEILGVAVNEKDLLGLKAVLANWHSLPDADKAKLLRGESA